MGTKSRVAGARVLGSVEELDQVFHELAALGSDEALRGALSALRMERPAGVSVNPHSEEYRHSQVALCHELSGRPHVTSHPGVRRSTQEDALVVRQALTHLGDVKGATVLEFGEDAGVAAVALAKAGAKVISVKTEAALGDLVRQHAALHGVEVEVVHGDFSYLQRLAAPVDAVLFFRSFHRAFDHQLAFSALDAAILPGGKAVFAAEPISPTFPIAWGPRLDGESLWAMRRQRSLALGFREHYFFEAAGRAGWVGRRHDAPKPAVIACYELMRRKVWGYRFTATAPQLHSSLGKKSKGVLHVKADKPGYAMFGPFVLIPPGRWRATLSVRGLDGERPIGRGSLDVSSVGHVVASRHVDLGEVLDGEVSLEFELATQLLGTEVRLFSEAALEVEILELTIEAIP